MHHNPPTRNLVFETCFGGKSTLSALTPHISSKLRRAVRAAISKGELNRAPSMNRLFLARRSQLTPKHTSSSTLLSRQRVLMQFISPPESCTSETRPCCPRLVVTRLPVPRLLFIVWFQTVACGAAKATSATYRQDESRGCAQALWRAGNNSLHQSRPGLKVMLHSVGCLCSPTQYTGARR